MAIVNCIEPVEELSGSARDLHRAIIAYLEKLEGIRWSNQRIELCEDDELRAIFAHNRDEQKTHAAMVLEWIRGQDSLIDQELRDFLFTDERIPRH